MTYSQLREQPYIGTPLITKTEKMSDYHYLVSGSCIIIYRVRETDGIVEISRILGGKQNYISEIFGWESADLTAFPGFRTSR